jgi:CheY-like chemotaxis protein
LDLRTEPVELAAIVEAALETSRPVIDAAGHELTIDLPREPIHLSADPVRLAQVFANLLNNAAKYTGPGGRIRLSAERQANDVHVSVKDTGIGIARDVLPHIFDIFSQAKSAIGHSQGGLGIGLSLVKGLVELHDGSIEVRSAGPGQGSEFVVCLPLASQAPFREPESSDEEEPRPPVKRRRILIVDDNRDSADSLAKLLEIMGHEIGTAYDGEEAIQAAASFAPDVVLLDIGMPKLNGYDAGRRIRELPCCRNTFLIAVTGWGQEQDRRRTVEAGFNHHIVKPVNPEELMQVLASLPTRDAR